MPKKKEPQINKKRKLTRRDKQRIFLLAILGLGAIFVGMWTAVIKGDHLFSGNIQHIQNNFIELVSDDLNTKLQVQYSASTEFEMDYKPVSSSILQENTYVTVLYRWALFSSDYALKVMWHKGDLAHG